MAERPEWLVLFSSEAFDEFYVPVPSLNGYQMFTFERASHTESCPWCEDSRRCSIGRQGVVWSEVMKGEGPYARYADGVSALQ